jgi:hypothetical protein
LACILEITSDRGSGSAGDTGPVAGRVGIDPTDGERTVDQGMQAELMGSEADEDRFTEAELTALALSADPDAPLDADAVPLSWYLAQSPDSLPPWYMPTAMARPGKRWRIPVVVSLVAAFLIIEAFGLCSTYGQLVTG